MSLQAVWFQCSVVRNYTNADREWHLSRPGNFISHRWQAARPEFLSSPSDTIPLSTMHLTWSQWHYSVTTFFSRIVLVLCPFPQWEIPVACLRQDLANSCQDQAQVKGIACVHAVIVGSEICFSWVLLRQMGRDEKEEKHGGKWQCWGNVGTVHGGNGGWRCWWPLLLPFGWVWTSLPGEVRDGCCIMVYCKGYRALRQGSGLPAPVTHRRYLHGAGGYNLVTGDFSLLSFRSLLPSQTLTVAGSLQTPYHSLNV